MIGWPRFGAISDLSKIVWNVERMSAPAARTCSAFNPPLIAGREDVPLFAVPFRISHSG